MSLQALTSQSMGRVQAMKSTPDAAGAFNVQWRDIFAPVWVRNEVATASRIEQFARQQMNVTHELITMTAGIRVGMRYVDSTTGIFYLVQGDITEYATGGIPTYFHFVCEEQRPLAGN